MSNDKILTNTDSVVDERFPTVTGTTVGAKHGLDVSFMGSTGDAIRWDTTTTANVIYVGFAVPGGLNASAVWRIMSVNTSTNEVTWADGDDSYDNVWNDRASLTYV